jgi:hypothetical protein
MLDPLTGLERPMTDADGFAALVTLLQGLPDFATVRFGPFPAEGTTVAALCPRLVVLPDEWKKVYLSKPNEAAGVLRTVTYTIELTLRVKFQDNPLDSLMHLVTALEQAVTNTPLVDSLPDESEITSGTYKLGRGQTDEQTVTLRGRFAYFPF